MNMLSSAKSNKSQHASRGNAITKSVVLAAHAAVSIVSGQPAYPNKREEDSGMAVEVAEGQRGKIAPAVSKKKEPFPKIRYPWSILNTPVLRSVRQIEDVANTTKVKPNTQRVGKLDHQMRNNVKNQENKEPVKTRRFDSAVKEVVASIEEGRFGKKERKGGEIGKRKRMNTPIQKIPSLIFPPIDPRPKNSGRSATITLDGGKSFSVLSLLSKKRNAPSSNSSFGNIIQDGYKQPAPSAVSSAGLLSESTKYFTAATTPYFTARSSPQNSDEHIHGSTGEGITSGSISLPNCLSGSTLSSLHYDNKGSTDSLSGISSLPYDGKDSGDLLSGSTLSSLHYDPGDDGNSSSMNSVSLLESSSGGSNNSVLSGEKFGRGGWTYKEGGSSSGEFSGNFQVYQPDGSRSASPLSFEFTQSIDDHMKGSVEVNKLMKAFSAQPLSRRLN